MSLDNGVCSIKLKVATLQKWSHLLYYIAISRCITKEPYVFCFTNNPLSPLQWKLKALYIHSSSNWELIELRELSGQITMANRFSVLMADVSARSGQKKKDFINFKGGVLRRICLKEDVCLSWSKSAVHYWENPSGSLAAFNWLCNEGLLCWSQVC